MPLTGHIIQTTSFMLHLSEMLMFSVCNLMLYRHDKSSGMKNARATSRKSLRDRSGKRHVQELEEDASASSRKSLRDRSGKRHVQELEQESDILPDSSSPNRRQSQSTHEPVGRSGQTKNVSLTARTLQIKTRVPGNSESFNERQGHIEATYVFPRDESNYFL
jgi:hypothetical protein